MQNLNYSIAIKAPKKSVWEKMIDPKSYKIWTRAFSPNSTFEGEWKEGDEIKFIDAGKGGTVALLEKVHPYEEIRARHVAIINANKQVIRSGDEIANWVGTKETYHFKESDGITTLEVTMESHPDFMKMFEESWPKALEEIKKLVED